MNDYFDASDHTITSGTRARAAVINAALEDLETGFDTLPSEDNIKMGLVNYAVDSGAANAYVVTLPHAPSAYTDGLQVVFKALAANTGACTINVNALGVKTITRQDGTAPVAGDIGLSKITEIRYNSTSANFEIQGSIGASAGTGTMAAQNANAVDIVGGTIKGITAEADAGAVVTVDGTQTLTNKTLTSPAGDVATLTGTQTLTNKTLTSPKINENVAAVATSTEIDFVCYGASSGSAAADNNFNGGTIYWSKIGNIVTVFWSALTGSGASTTKATSTGFIPAAFRPSASVYNVVYAVAAHTTLVEVDEDGFFTVAFFDWAGAGSSQNAVTPGSISYMV